jgi:hypothetical protein
MGIVSLLAPEHKKMRRWNRLYPFLFLCLLSISSQSTSQTGGTGKNVPSGLDETETKPEERRVQSPASAPLGYKGLLMADVNPGNSFKDEVVADFGSLGLWVYEQMTWHQISGANPEWIMAVSLADSPAKQVIVDLGAEGLWRWSYSGYPGDWKQISGLNALWAVAVDDDGDGRQELQVIFGPAGGIWRYDEGDGDAGSWRQISTSTPIAGLKTDFLPSGQEEGCYIFSATGIWTICWTGSDALYQQLTGSAESSGAFASAKLIGGAGEDLAMDFGTKGIWLCQNDDRIWHQLSEKPVARTKAVRSGAVSSKLIIDFKGDEGLFVWSFAGHPGTLTKLHHADPDFGFFEPFDPDGRSEKSGEEELAIDFGANGLWKYDFSRRTWTLLNTKNPEFMTAGDCWNEGSQATLAVDFGSDGLWLYEGRYGGWFKISNNSPDGGY